MAPMPEGYLQMKIDITSWRDGRVLFSWDCENNTIKLTVEAGVKAGADMQRAGIINLAARLTRSDGYEFFGWQTDKGLIIRAGCRTMTLPEYRAHVLTYDNQGKIRETTRILDYIEGASK